MIIREVYSLEKDDNILKYALCNNKENRQFSVEN